MSDASAHAGSQDHVAARKAVAEAVLSTPGVVRIEPSLRQAVRQLASLRRLRGDEARQDWELVELSAEDSAVSTRLDIGVDFSRTFVDIGDEVRNRVHHALVQNGFRVGRVDVSILTARR